MDTPLAMDWAMEEAAAAPETPVSSVCCERLLDIDPRLLVAEAKVFQPRRMDVKKGPCRGLSIGGSQNQCILSRLLDITTLSLTDSPLSA